MAETRAYATLLANTVSPRSVAVMKRQLWEAEFQTLAEATTQANYEMELSFQTSDFKEGVSSFLEKRPPNFPPYAWIRDDRVVVPPSVPFVPDPEPEEDRKSVV